MAGPALGETAIHGVVLVPVTPHPDLRGFFAETYRRDWIPGMEEMVQGNVSRSRPNVLRGLHYHRRQADYWTVLEGVAFVGLFDLRRGSPTEGSKAEVELSAEALRCLYIPKGVAHGFYTADGIVLQYLVDRYYSGDDEFGVAWDDPSLGIDWPTTQPILSDRDRSNPSLAEVMREAPPFQG
jgi:dTDP-4-dehydrorhamnose 3,5-epimerase